MITGIEAMLRQVTEAAGYPYPAGVAVEEPPAHVVADYATNVALQVAKAEGVNPREVAEQLRELLLSRVGVAAVEVAGPGFLNLTLTDAPYTAAFQDLRERAGRHNLWGDTAPVPQQVVVEFISANPTGPLHIGNARGGPMGETIARALEARGHQVHRDFYVNDIGGQAHKFALSVLHYYKLHFGVESEFPESGYPAPYVQEVAEEVATSEGDSILKLPADQQPEAVREAAIAKQVAKIRATADRMGISFATWSNQSELVASGRSAATLAILQERGATMEKDGAVWLKSGLQDDDRETVLVKSDKTTTYFLDDIAFYRMKLEEWGKDYAICVLGANHSGHIPRMRAGIAGLGLDPERYQGTLYQYVQLKENGETRRMAKREGTFVTADQVLDEIPRDVFTWFMLSKAPETHLDFDLQLARDTSEKNPIYYVQYAHARIHSVLAKAGAAGEHGEAATQYNGEERALIRYLSQFPGVVDDVALRYRTHVLPLYLLELATRYHHFYAHHRVMGDDENVTALRLELSRLTAATLKAGLGLMNISAPERM